MEELYQILRVHGSRYPLMEPADAVKLIYQNEFGGGHLIRDEERVMEYLRREYASIIRDPGQLPREPIGNGIVRVHLAALEREQVEMLGREFIRSANLRRGSVERFREKLEILRKLTAEGFFRFSLRELDGYLSEYAAAGYPAVSHSESYRNAYHPAYRIVKE